MLTHIGIICRNAIKCMYIYIYIHTLFLNNGLNKLKYIYRFIHISNPKAKFVTLSMFFFFLFWGNALQDLNAIKSSAKCIKSKRITHKMLLLNGFIFIQFSELFFKAISPDFHRVQRSYLSDLLVEDGVLLGKTVVILHRWGFWSPAHVFVLAGETVHRILSCLGFE